jgi:hypothetical protein
MKIEEGYEGIGKKKEIAKWKISHRYGKGRKEEEKVEEVRRESE